MSYTSFFCFSRSKEQLVAEAEKYARSTLLVEEADCPPAMMKKTVGKMGLKGVPGLRLEGKVGVTAPGKGGGKGRAPRSG